MDASPSATGDRAVVLLSGGLDSGTAAALWCAQGRAIALALFADYGQRAVEREAESSMALAGRLGVPWRRIGLPWLAGLAAASGSALVQGASRPVPERSSGDPGDAESAAAVWVPARNLVLVAAAAAHAETLGATTVVVGFNREEAATFPDNSEAFVHALASALRLATRAGLGIASPTQGMDKRGIVAAARRLGLTQADFWSCYLGGAAPCGTCESCARSARAWA